MIIDDKLIDRVYDTLPKMPRTNEPYYSRSAIRLILSTEAGIVGAAFRLTEDDGGPCPIHPPDEPIHFFGQTTAATATPFSATQEIAEANAAITNEGTLDIRATLEAEDEALNRRMEEACERIRNDPSDIWTPEAWRAPKTYGDVLPGLIDWQFKQAAQESDDNLKRFLDRIEDAARNSPTPAGAFLSSTAERMFKAGIEHAVKAVRAEADCILGHSKIRGHESTFTATDEEPEPTGQPEPRTRGRVRDELRTIIREYVTNRDAAARIVERILNALHCASPAGPAAAFIFDVREGDL